MSDAVDRLSELGADLVHDVLRPARGEFHRDAFTAALSDARPNLDELKDANTYRLRCRLRDARSLIRKFQKAVEALNSYGKC
jgi:hypothetical protein